MEDAQNFETEDSVVILDISEEDWKELFPNESYSYSAESDSEQNSHNSTEEEISDTETLTNDTDTETLTGEESSEEEAEEEISDTDSDKDISSDKPVHPLVQPDRLYNRPRFLQYPAQHRLPQHRFGRFEPRPALLPTPPHYFRL